MCERAEMGPVRACPSPRFPAPPRPRFFAVLTQSTSLHSCNTLPTATVCIKDVAYSYRMSAFCCSSALLLSSLP